MKKLIFSFVLCLLIQGNVSAETTMKLVPQVLKGQKIIPQEDSEAIISHKKKSSVALRPPPVEYSPEGRPMILVTVFVNDKQYDFSAKDIKVFVDGTPHKILAYDEYVKEIKQRKSNEIKTIESKYAALSRNTAEGAYTSSSDAEVSTPGARDNVIGSQSSGGTQFNIHSLARGQSEINADMQAEKDLIEKRTAEELAVADSIMLKKTTVLPNKRYDGYIALEKLPDPAQPHEVKIIVSAAGEKHEFLFKHLKAQE